MPDDLQNYYGSWNGSQHNVRRRSINLDDFFAFELVPSEVEKNPQKQGYQAKGDKKPTS
jgi:hypothetical protein